MSMDLSEIFPLVETATTKFLCDLIKTELKRGIRF